MLGFIFGALCMSSLSFAAEEKPDVLVYVRDPWLMVIGSDTPILSAYKTGEIIWQENKLPNGGEYKSVKLNKTEYAEFLSRLKDLSKLNEEYVLTGKTDQPEENMEFNILGKSKKINVYGSLASKECRDKAPKELLEMYDFLANYKNEKSKNWQPEFIEVMIWPYEYAPDKSIVWPQGWPDIESNTTRKFKESYSIYMPVENKDALYKFIGSRNEKGAVEINGKKWAIATRIPFPHELNK
jgi:hypothetical protein